MFENEVKLYESAQAATSGIGNVIQDRAKKSVEKISTFGAKFSDSMRSHLAENPFAGFRNNNPEPGSRSHIHPSLIRPSTTAYSDPQLRRTAKPLPPVPAGALPPQIPAGNVAASPWDAFPDNKASAAKNPVTGRPKAATVSAATGVALLNPAPLVHSTSSSSITAVSLAPDILVSGTKNVFEFNPFGDFDPTPATPAPSISNSMIRPTSEWYQGSQSVENSGSVSNPPNPFVQKPAPTTFSLPKISMKPLNPFTEPDSQDSNNSLSHTEPNLFTSFSLDTLAPSDIHSHSSFPMSKLESSHSYPLSSSPFSSTPFNSVTQPSTPFNSVIQDSAPTPYNSVVQSNAPTPYNSVIQENAPTPYNSVVAPSTPYNSVIQDNAPTPYNSVIQENAPTPYNSVVQPSTPFNSVTQPNSIYGGFAIPTAEGLASDDFDSFFAKR